MINPAPLGMVAFAAGLFASYGVAANCSVATSPIYKNASYSVRQRAEDLLPRLTWVEKVGQMGGIRAAFKSVNGSIVFNRTSFEQIRATQNGQIGKLPDILN